MNEDQTPEEIVAEVKEIVKTVWTTGAAPPAETDVREIVASAEDHAALVAGREAAGYQSVKQLKSELRLKTAARYGNRHDRRQAESLARKAATKAKHLAWKKASQKGTPVAATPLPAGAHQPGILNAVSKAVRELARESGILLHEGVVIT